MKLRNKKTGEIVDLSEGIVKDMCYGKFIQIKPEAISNKEGYLYGSLAELNEEWEDYKPAEPLIKDEKIRKAVRAWAEALKIKACEYNAYLKAFCFGKSMVCFKGEYYFSELTDKKYYDIAELCGEEE